MIQAIIVDDEKHCIDTLRIQLKEYCSDVNVVATCRSAEEGVQAINDLNPDLIFLDIEMPAMNGFEMLEQFSEIPFAIIFTTSYDQYALKAIHFSALDYLMKPIVSTDLIRAVKKVQEQRHLPLAEQFQMLLKQIQSKDHQLNKLAVPTAAGFELIPVDQVLHCEASDNYTHLHLKNRNKIIACRTLKEIEEQLQDFSFFIRVHNSHLVNLNEVVRYVRSEGGYLVLSDGTSITVSKRKKEMLLQTLLPNKPGN